ncbi:hypothetical protein V6Z11_D08G269800 [Gossypium hirsutum]
MASTSHGEVSLSFYNPEAPSCTAAHVAGNLVHPHKLLFLPRASCLFVLFFFGTLLCSCFFPFLFASSHQGFC